MSTTVAAVRLGVSPTTVLNWLRKEKLAGIRGDQPVRPRWYVLVDERGDPVDPDGVALRPGPRPDVEHLVAEVRQLRGAISHERQRSPDTLREVALLIRSAADRQQRALELQSQAVQELSAALREQGEAISQLLLPDTVEDLA